MRDVDLILIDTVVQREDMHRIFEEESTSLSKALCEVYDIRGWEDVVIEGREEPLLVINKIIKIFKKN